MEFDSATIADACNADSRFEEAGWHETAGEINTLLESAAFPVVLLKVATHSKPPSLLAAVAAVYACRLAEGQRRRHAGGR